MKRILVIPIMFLYIIAVSGVMIHAHYCGKELASWQVYAKNDKGCKDDVCTDKEGKEKGCCSDKVVVSKVTNDQNVVSFFKLQLSSAAFILPNTVYPVLSAGAFLFNTQTITSGQPNAPPGRWQQIPLFKLHSRFTYYG